MSVGSFIGGMFGQSNFKAKPYEVLGDQYNDPYLAQNEATIMGANSTRQGMATPQTQAAMAQGPNFAQSDQMRAMQLGGLQGLGAAANGQVPSAAELQGQQQLAQALQQQAGMAASMRGVSPALAQHIAAQAGAQMQGQALSNAAQLRANEQANARNAFAQALSGARGQDLGAAQTAMQGSQFNAGMQQQAGMANQQAALQAQQQRDQMAQFYDSTRFGMENKQFDANMAWDQARQSAYNTAMGIQAGVATGNAANAAQVTGAGVGAGGAGLAALSDARAKTKVQRRGANRDMDAFLEALDSASYEYKEGVGEDTSRRRYGVMAQSVAKSKVGRSFVNKRDDGLLELDVTKGFGAILAGQKRLHERLKSVGA